VGPVTLEPVPPVPLELPPAVTTSPAIVRLPAVDISMASLTEMGVILNALMVFTAIRFSSKITIC
jgi:hypothetical protein